MVRVACCVVAALALIGPASAPAQPALRHLEMDVMDANESPEQAVQRMDKRRRAEEAATPRARPAEVPAESPAVGNDPLVIRSLDSTTSINPLATSPDPALLGDHGPGKDKSRAKDHHAANDVTNPVQIGLNDGNSQPKPPKDPKPGDGNHKDSKGHGH